MNDIRPDIMPKAREDRLIIKELPDETLVYDLDTDQAHCLNSTAAMVWKNCDGQKPIMQITAALEKEAGESVDEALVWLALEKLEAFKLLDQTATPSKVADGISRRHLMRRLGVAAVALPVIVSIIAPTPASAVSCPGKTSSGGGCTGNGTCCSNVCCPGPGCTGANPSGTCL